MQHECVYGNVKLGSQRFVRRPFTPHASWNDVAQKSLYQVTVGNRKC